MFWLREITHVGDFDDLILSDFQDHLQIDLNKKLIYPGLILPISKVGLEEISAIRATLDHTEIGDINSNIRTLTSYNTDSKWYQPLDIMGYFFPSCTWRWLNYREFVYNDDGGMELGRCGI